MSNGGCTILGADESGSETLGVTGVFFKLSPQTIYLNHIMSLHHLSNLFNNNSRMWSTYNTLASAVAVVGGELRLTSLNCVTSSSSSIAYIWLWRTCRSASASLHNLLRPHLDHQIHTQISLCKKKIPHHIKILAHAWSTKCRWNQKLIAQFCCTLRDEHFEPN
jgi:hypothetical protein